MSRGLKKKSTGAKRPAAGGPLAVPVVPRKERWLIPGICFFLAVIVWVVFGQALGFGFVNYDDNAYVYENPYIISGLSWKAIPWSLTYIHSGNWHPLTTLSHMLDCQLWSLQPWGHHLDSVLLHCAAVILLFLALNQMTRMPWRSAFVAAVFAIHPLRAESVAWVSERKDVLSGVFFMITLLAYARYVGGGKSKSGYFAVMVFFALALMSKPTVVTLPFLLLLLDWWPLGRLKGGSGEIWSGVKPLILEKIPLLLLSIGSCLATLIAQKGALVNIEVIPLPYRVANAVVSYVIYIFQMFWPTGLAVFYPHPGNTLPMWEAVFALMILAAITWAVCALGKRQPWLAAGWFWYLGMLVPVVGIVQVGMQAHSDRYTYLPEIGLAIMLTWAGADLAEKLRFPRWAPGAVSACVIAILMILAYNQASYWHDSELLWTHAIACTENNYIAHNNLGNVLMRRGDFNDAIAQYEMALGTKPDFAEAQNNLGNVLSKEGALDEAIPHYEKALLIKPDYADAHYNFGNVLSKKGEWADAITQFETALKIKPDSAESHQGLGIAYRHTGRADEAVAQYKAALELKPDFAEAQSNLAYLLATCPDARLRNGSMAVGLAERANLLTGGNNPVVLGTLAAAYAEAGRFPDAIGAVSQAIQFAEAQGNRALDSTLEGHLKLYESGKPLRDN